MMLLMMAFTFAEFRMWLNRSYLFFENRLLLTIQWIACNEKYKALAERFGVSKSMVSAVIRETIHILVEFCVKHIPHQSQSLSNSIIYIIDGTPHQIMKPTADQYLFWRRDKQMHFINTIIVSDFESNIIAHSTNYMGHHPDSVVSRKNSMLRSLTSGDDGHKYCAGDPGFEGIPFIISGLRSARVRVPRNPTLSIGIVLLIYCIQYNLRDVVPLGKR